MSFLKDLLKRKKESIKNYNDFWIWFNKYKNTFFNAVKKGNNIEQDFFDKLSPKLAELNDGYFFLTGMEGDDTAELVLSAEGAVKNIVFVEELVKAAPTIAGWKFTALKPALDIKDVNIKMANYDFNAESLSFYSNEHTEFPDEIDITIVHRDFNETDKSVIVNGTYIFIDHYIGELNSATLIDNLDVVGRGEAKKELIPIVKLKDFLIWRQKEFIERYEGTLQNTDDAEFSVLEAELESGNILIATINTEILNWKNKASHPWVITLTIEFDGKANNGMPDQETYQLLNTIEDKALADLKDHDGYLNIGRQTVSGVREVYFVCKDFRKPSKVLLGLSNEYAHMKITFDIYKDKYWRSFDRFKPGL